MARNSAAKNFIFHSIQSNLKNFDDIHKELSKNKRSSQQKRKKMKKNEYKIYFKTKKANWLKRK